MYIQKVNLIDAQQVWQYETEIISGGLNSSSSSMLKYRYYEDDSKVMHKELVYAANSKALCIDADKGEALAELNMSGAIRAIPIARSGPLGYAAMSTGTIDILNYPTGDIMSDFRIETDLTITDLKVADGIFAVKSFSSPDILIMKDQFGQGMEEVLTADGSYLKFIESLDGKHIAIYNGISYIDELYFINGGKEPQRADVTIDDSDRLLVKGFTKKGQFITISQSGKATLVDPDSLSKKEVELDVENLHITDVAVNSEMSHAVLYSSRDMVLVDLSELAIKGNYSISDEMIIQAEIDNKSDKIYFATDKSGLCVLDIKSGEIKKVSDETDNICDSMYQIMALSKNGEYIAAVCKDGKTRIIDKAGKLLSEIDYSGYYNSFMEFSDDDAKLILQGDDYYIRVYDVMTGEKCYASQNQYNAISSIKEFNTGSRLAIVTSAGIVVLETNTYNEVALIDEGCLITSDGKVMTSHYGNVYSFPFQSIKSLKEAAKEQLGNQELSEEKRTKYHLLSFE